MVKVRGVGVAEATLKTSLTKLAIRIAAVVVGLALFYGGCVARVRPNEFGVEQRKFGFNKGIVASVYSPGLYFVGPGAAMHAFPREIHVLEATYDLEDARSKARDAETVRKVQKYFERRDEELGEATHRTIQAINVQTSDGYAVTVDLTLLYTITDPVRVARDFGWGSLYVDSFVVNTFRNSILTTLGKMNAEAFYDGAARIKAVAEAQALLAQRFGERGLKVERLLLRNVRYADSYEKSLRDKKLAVQLAEKNRKESLVNEEKAKLRQIESKGNAAITIAQAEVETKIAKIRAEAELYASQTRAKADREVNVGTAEAKRLKADALNAAGGRYVVALETAKMFDNIEAAAMTPEQYITFVRSAWALIGVGPGAGGANTAPPARGGK
jgi:regulator of protease activity HflC (stomatin/prohibitin superfamily)